MALTNFTLPFGGLTSQNWAATISPLQPHHATAVNNLLYGPAGHQESDEPPAGIPPEDYYKNNPYSLPPQQSPQFRTQKTNKNYLPPPPPSASLQSNLRNGNVREQQQHQFNQPSATYLPSQRGYGEGEGNYEQSLTQQGNVRASTQFFNGYNTQTRTYTQDSGKQSLGDLPINQDQNVRDDDNNNDDDTAHQGYPERAPGFTRVQAGKGSRTQVHAVLDYDAEEGDEADYYDEEDSGTLVKGDGKPMPTVTPIQGPIFLKNGTVPVVPLFSYPTLNNGTFVQIPIWWTALSVALGLDIRGDIIRGVPCVKRFHQLFCPTAGNSYPIDKIERFIDDNKALMRRMYGDFEMTPDFGPTQQNRKRRRSIDEPDLMDLSGIPSMYPKPGDDLELVPDSEVGETYFGKLRKKRQSTSFRGGGGGGGGNQGNKRNQTPPPPPRGPANGPNGGTESSTGRVDSCESKIEIVTPYWASNSAGKIRAIVNTQHFEQAIHQEICTKVQTSRCGNDCGCEQKYKWHRLLAYDPDNDCKGIFMDWFLFPSCCVCRCSP